MKIINDWVNLDKMDKYEQELLTQQSNNPKLSIESIFRFYKDVNNYIIAYIARNILGDEYLEDKLKEYQEKSQHLVKEQHVKYQKDIVDTINHATSWWFDTEIRVKNTKNW